MYEGDEDENDEYIPEMYEYKRYNKDEKEFLVTPSFSLVLSQTCIKFGITVEDLMRDFNLEKEYVEGLLNRKGTCTKSLVRLLENYLETSLPEIDPVLKQKKIDNWLSGNYMSSIIGDTS